MGGLVALLRLLCFKVCDDLLAGRGQPGNCTGSVGGLRCGVGTEACAGQVVGALVLFTHCVTFFLSLAVGLGLILHTTHVGCQAFTYIPITDTAVSAAVCLFCNPAKPALVT